MIFAGKGNSPQMLISGFVYIDIFSKKNRRMYIECYPPSLRAYILSDETFSLQLSRINRYMRVQFTSDRLCTVVSKEKETIGFSGTHIEHGDFE